MDSRRNIVFNFSSPIRGFLAQHKLSDQCSVGLIRSADQWQSNANSWSISNERVCRWIIGYGERSHRGSRAFSQEWCLIPSRRGYIRIDESPSVMRPNEAKRDGQSDVISSRGQLVRKWHCSHPHPFAKDWRNFTFGVIRCVHSSLFSRRF
jgi:hypothetical protein